jgi:hypothetical protein
MKEIQAFHALTQAYLLLLQMPHGGVRARNQSVLCALRDAIATEAAMAPQEVQDEFEAQALLQRMAA